MSKLRKRDFFIDSIFTTGFILVFVYLLSLIPFNSDLVNPISKAVSDFELTDIVFSHIRESPPVEENIVMVNIGPSYRDRRDLARLVSIINLYEPKVIGIDAFFRKSKGDSIDKPLEEAFSKVKNLVLVSELWENPNSDLCDSMGTSNAKFMRYAQPGFADMITKGKDYFKTARECTPKEHTKSYHKWVDTSFNAEVYEFGEKTIVKKDSSIWKKIMKDTIFYSFPVKIASLYAPERTKDFVERNQDSEIINFQGNIDVRKEDVARNAKIVFTALDYSQIEDTLFTPDTFKDKIVIIGYMGEDLADNRWGEDKFFTPLNANYIGKANPEMYGVVVHANIVSMILKGQFIDEMPTGLNYILSIILIFFNVWFFSYLYLRTEIWYDGLSNIITIVLILVLITLVVVVFHWYYYVIDITLPSVALFLTGNLVELHFGVVKPTFLKFRDRVPFLQKLIPIFTIK